MLLRGHVLVSHLEALRLLSSLFGPWTFTSLYPCLSETLPKRLPRSDGADEEQPLFVSKSLADITFPRDSVEMKKDYFIFPSVYHERN